MNQDLSMIRGDTFSFLIRLPEIDPASITSLIFTVKRKATDSDDEAIIQKRLGDGIEPTSEEREWSVRVAPEDTDGVAAKKCVYDIQVGIMNDIYTLMGGYFRILQDVTEART